MSNLKIKLNLEEDGKFTREKWHGYGPFSAVIGDDDSLSVNVPGQELQIVPQRENAVGNYWMFKLDGGLAFASVVNHDTYGTYMTLRLNDEVELPAEIQANIKKHATKNTSTAKTTTTKKPPVKKAKKWS